MKSVLQIAFAFGLVASLPLAGCTGETEADSNDTTQKIAPASSNIRDISIDEANALLTAEEGAVVLDVRTPAEFEAGHIDGAVNADFLGDDFAKSIADLDRDTTYILHCKSGSRSTRAVEVLKSEGFTSVAHLTDGYDGWKAAQDAE